MPAAEDKFNEGLVDLKRTIRAKAYEECAVIAEGYVNAIGVPWG